MGHLSTLILIVLLPYSWSSLLLPLGSLGFEGNGGGGFDGSFSDAANLQGSNGIGFDASLGASKSLQIGDNQVNPQQRPNIIFDLPVTTNRPIFIIPQPPHVLPPPPPCAHPAPPPQYHQRPGPGPARHYRTIEINQSAEVRNETHPVAQKEHLHARSVVLEHPSPVALNANNTKSNATDTVKDQGHPAQQGHLNARNLEQGGQDQYADQQPQYNNDDDASGSDHYIAARAYETPVQQAPQQAYQGQEQAYQGQQQAYQGQQQAYQAPQAYQGQQQAYQGQQQAYQGQQQAYQGQQQAYQPAPQDHRYVQRAKQGHPAEQGHHHARSVEEAVNPDLPVVIDYFIVKDGNKSEAHQQDHPQARSVVLEHPGAQAIPNPKHPNDVGVNHDITKGTTERSVSPRLSGMANMYNRVFGT